MLDVGSSSAMRELVVQIARHRRGLALLHLADLECAAVMLGVDAFTVSRARQALASAEERAQLIAEVRRARQEILSSPPGAPGCGPHGPPRTAKELIRCAAEHELGLEFLRGGFLESVAVIHHVHPKLVLRARALLQRFDARKGRPAGD